MQRLCVGQRSILRRQRACTAVANPVCWFAMWFIPSQIEYTSRGEGEMWQSLSGTFQHQDERNTLHSRIEV